MDNTLASMLLCGPLFDGSPSSSRRKGGGGGESVRDITKRLGSADRFVREAAIASLRDAVLLAAAEEEEDAAGARAAPARAAATGGGSATLAPPPPRAGSGAAYDAAVRGIARWLGHADAGVRESRRSRR